MIQGRDYGPNWDRVNKSGQSQEKNRKNGKEMTKSMMKPRCLA